MGNIQSNKIYDLILSDGTELKNMQLKYSTNLGGEKFVVFKDLNDNERVRINSRYILSIKLK